MDSSILADIHTVLLLHGFITLKVSAAADTAQAVSAASLRQSWSRKMAAVAEEVTDAGPYLQLTCHTQEVACGCLQCDVQLEVRGVCVCMGLQCFSYQLSSSWVDEHIRDDQPNLCGAAAAAEHEHHEHQFRQLRETSMSQTPAARLTF